jgi:UDP-N-acetyl-D-galactosamine dehydrogenase
MKVAIGVIGLGYVGLPLAVEFGKVYATVGFDINEKRIYELKKGIDLTLEVEPEEMQASVNLAFSSILNDLSSCNIYIVTVPTPVDKHNVPDLSPLRKASAMLGKILKRNDIVVYESTVYPGATEEVCVPILEKESGLIFNSDFFCGYSPERINPGDKKNKLTTIRKITSGSNAEVAEKIDNIYGSIIKAGTYKASSIKVAEAAKVIENAQRDINIAFVNELSKIFNKLNIDTIEVLEAAETKWNFLPFRPGLVGGHCIGVDPYYLAQKAQEVGYHPEIILAGRRINDGMGEYVANEIVRLHIKEDKKIANSKVLILGITFKENVPDIRNSKIVDIYTGLKNIYFQVDICDPHASAEEVKHEYNVELKDFKQINFSEYSCIVLAVAHNDFKHIDIASIKKAGCIIYDVKSILPKNFTNGRL